MANSPAGGLSSTKRAAGKWLASAGRPLSPLVVQPPLPSSPVSSPSSGFAFGESQEAGGGHTHPRKDTVITVVTAVGAFQDAERDMEIVKLYESTKKMLRALIDMYKWYAGAVQKPKAAAAIAKLRIAVSRLQTALRDWQRSIESRSPNPSPTRRKASTGQKRGGFGVLEVMLKKITADVESIAGTYLTTTERMMHSVRCSGKYDPNAAFTVGDCPQLTELFSGEHGIMVKMLGWLTAPGYRAVQSERENLLRWRKEVVAAAHAFDEVVQTTFAGRWDAVLSTADSMADEIDKIRKRRGKAVEVRSSQYAAAVDERLTTVREILYNAAPRWKAKEKPSKAYEAETQLAEAHKRVRGEKWELYQKHEALTGLYNEAQSQLAASRKENERLTGELRNARGQLEEFIIKFNDARAELRRVQRDNEKLQQLVKGWESERAALQRKCASVGTDIEAGLPNRELDNEDLPHVAEPVECTEQLRKFADKLATMWLAKSGADVLSELESNLDHPTERDVAMTLTERYASLTVPKAGDNTGPAQTLIQLLYTYEGIDTDFLMGYPEAERKSYRKEYQDKYKRNPKVPGDFPKGLFPLGKDEESSNKSESSGKLGGAPKALFRLWNWAMRTVYSAYGRDRPEKAILAAAEAVLEKWIKTLLTLSVASREFQAKDIPDAVESVIERVKLARQEHKHDEKQVAGYDQALERLMDAQAGWMDEPPSSCYRAIAYSEELVKSQTNLKPGDFVAVNQASSTALVRSSAESFLQGHAVLWEIELPVRGARLWDISRFPSEAELLLPVGSMLEVIEEPKMHKLHRCKAPGKVCGFEKDLSETQQPDKRAKCCDYLHVRLKVPADDIDLGKNWKLACDGAAKELKRVNEKFIRLEEGRCRWDRLMDCVGRLRTAVSKKSEKGVNEETKQITVINSGHRAGADTDRGFLDRRALADAFIGCHKMLFSAFHEFFSSFCGLHYDTIQQDLRCREALFAQFKRGEDAAGRLELIMLNEQLTAQLQQEQSIHDDLVAELHQTLSQTAGAQQAYQHLRWGGPGHCKPAEQLQRSQALAAAVLQDSEHCARLQLANSWLEARGRQERRLREQDASTLAAQRQALERRSLREQQMNYLSERLGESLRQERERYAGEQAETGLRLADLAARLAQEQDRCFLLNSKLEIREKLLAETSQELARERQRLTAALAAKDTTIAELRQGALHRQGPPPAQERAQTPPPGRRPDLSPSHPLAVRSGSSRARISPAAPQSPPPARACCSGTWMAAAAPPPPTQFTGDARLGPVPAASGAGRFIASGGHSERPGELNR
eukprot:TRINITY_DN60637_c0_g1_i1.p1 TRINITY_DN60637_c0_g1~~TRINITY_DN60637_c0_g1_i1.p1  ORF type:complete len:1325 (+),score=219.87 TRINITY_DN60637_c0_g1_i1:67-3975(+)